MADLTLTIVVAEADATRTQAALSLAAGASTSSLEAALQFLATTVEQTVLNVEHSQDMQAAEAALPVQTAPVFTGRIAAAVER